jgi:hypothetical protein
LPVQAFAMMYVACACSLALAPTWLHARDVLLYLSEREVKGKVAILFLRLLGDKSRVASK